MTSIASTTVGSTSSTKASSRMRSGFMSLVLTALDKLALRRRVARERREFEGLGVDILRDLGVSRYEFNSFVVEYGGYAEETRLRVARVRNKRPLV